MMNKFFSRKLIIAIGTTISCPFAFSNCELQMRNIDYFHQSGSKYKIRLLIEEACSENIIYKRKIKNITLELFNEKHKIQTFFFNEGHWLPTHSRFHLKTNTSFMKGCFKGSKNITLNLQDNILNSTSGLYLNLKTGEHLKLNCNLVN